MPRSFGARPDRPERVDGVDGTDGQLDDAPDSRSARVRLEQAVSVRVGHVHRVFTNDDAVGAEVEAPSSGHLKRRRVDLDEPARVVRVPQRPSTVRETLRAPEHERLTNEVVRGRINLRNGRAAHIALIVVARPYVAATQCDLAAEIDRTRRDARHDPTTPRVNSRDAPVGSVRHDPHGAEPDREIPAVHRQARGLANYLVRARVDAPHRRPRSAGQHPYRTCASREPKARVRELNSRLDRRCVRPPRVGRGIPRRRSRRALRGRICGARENVRNTCAGPEEQRADDGRGDQEPTPAIRMPAGRPARSHARPLHRQARGRSRRFRNPRRARAARSRGPWLGRVPPAAPRGTSWTLV
jgi:hypothetical protein